MTRHARTYRALVQLYPSRFRREYADDLVQSFVDLIERDGPARAWARTTIDLSCTVPRYRLESVMSAKSSNLALQLTVGGLALAGFASILVGAYPGALLLLVAAVYGISQRSQLAQATRTPDPERRTRLLKTAGILAAVCVVGTTAMFVEISGDEHWHGGKLALYNLFFFVTAFGALYALVAGLRTPRRPTRPGRTVAA